MTANKKAAPLTKDAAEIKTKQPKFTSNNVADQRARLLEALEAGPLTTIEIRARRDLDIMMPAARIFELRRMGKNIVTTWTDQPTDGGRMHRIALYALQPAPQVELFGAFDAPHNGQHVATVTP